MNEPKRNLPGRYYKRLKLGENYKAYTVWEAMMRRCNDPRFHSYPRYGGRGITVCDRWKSFDNFLQDMGNPGLGLSLERKNNDLGYGADNCIWATAKQQARNRRNNKTITHNGKTLCYAAWEQEMGWPSGLIGSRIANKMPPIEALETPYLKATSGSRNGKAKLTEEAAVEICNRYAAGELQKALAKQFGVGRACISKVICGDTWTAAKTTISELSKEVGK